MSHTTPATRATTDSAAPPPAESDPRLVTDEGPTHAELERLHYLLMIETMVRAGQSEDEITRAIQDAHQES
jgi:hypothetical protein